MVYLYSGEEAQRVFNDAQAMLKMIIDQKLLQASGAVCIYPAYSVIDDIYVFKEEIGIGEPKAIFYGLRQQVHFHGVIWCIRAHFFLSDRTYLTE